MTAMAFPLAAGIVTNAYAGPSSEPQPVASGSAYSTSTTTSVSGTTTGTVRTSSTVTTTQSTTTTTHPIGDIDVSDDSPGLGGAIPLTGRGIRKVGSPGSLCAEFDLNAKESGRTYGILLSLLACYQDSTPATVRALPPFDEMLSPADALENFKGMVDNMIAQAQDEAKLAKLQKMRAELDRFPPQNENIEAAGAIAPAGDAEALFQAASFDTIANIQPSACSVPNSVPCVQDETQFPGEPLPALWTEAVMNNFQTTRRSTRFAQYMEERLNRHPHAFAYTTGGNRLYAFYRYNEMLRANNASPEAIPFSRINVVALKIIDPYNSNNRLPKIAVWAGALPQNADGTVASTGFVANFGNEFPLINRSRQVVEEQWNGFETVEVTRDLTSEESSELFDRMKDAYVKLSVLGRYTAWLKAISFQDFTDADDDGNFEEIDTTAENRHPLFNLSTAKTARTMYAIRRALSWGMNNVPDQDITLNVCRDFTSTCLDVNKEDDIVENDTPRFGLLLNQIVFRNNGVKSSESFGETPWIPAQHLDQVDANGNPGHDGVLDTVLFEKSPYRFGSEIQGTSEVTEYRFPKYPLDRSPTLGRVAQYIFGSTTSGPAGHENLSSYVVYAPDGNTTIDTYYYRNAMGEIDSRIENGNFLEHINDNVYMAWNRFYEIDPHSGQNLKMLRTRHYVRTPGGGRTLYSRFSPNPAEDKPYFDLVEYLECVDPATGVKSSCNFLKYRNFASYTSPDRSEFRTACSLQMTPYPGIWERKGTSRYHVFSSIDWFAPWQITNGEHYENMSILQNTRVRACWDGAFTTY